MNQVVVRDSQGLEQHVEIVDDLGDRFRVRGGACTIVDARPVAVTGTRDGAVRVWDLHHGTQRVEPVAVAGGSRDGTVRVWSLESMLAATVIDRPARHALLIAVYETEIVVGFGRDVAILARAREHGTRR